MVSNNDVIGFRKPQRYNLMKRMGLVCLLITVAMAAVACSSKSQDGIGDNNKFEDTVVQPSPTPATEPIPTEEPVVTAEPTPIVEPATTVEPNATTAPTPTKAIVKEREESTISDYIPTDEVLHSTTAFSQGDYLFYKTGKLTKTVIAAKNLKTGKVSEIISIDSSDLRSGEFFLKGNYIYYHEDGDIYRIGVDGKNKTRLYKGTAAILGIYKEDILALERKTRELIRIDKAGEKRSLTKLNSIDALEAVMVQDGLYYISKSSNNNLDGNDPIDRLYYIDFNGKNKTELHAALDIYDLKSYDNKLFFLSITEEPGVMKVNKVEKFTATTLHSFSKEELQELGCNWFEANTFTLLAADATHVYYGIDFNNGEAMNIYSVKIDGEKQELLLNAYDIEGINPAAYFMRGEIDDGYLKIVFDCDEAPVEIFLIDLDDKSSIKFKGDYYKSDSIDVEGQYVYYCKASQPDRYGEMPDAFEYGSSKISELR